MTVAELHFMETVPVYLRQIASELKALNETLNGIGEKSETFSNTQ